MFKKLIVTLSLSLLLVSNANASSFFEEIIPKNPTLSPYAGIDAGFTMGVNGGFPYNIHAGLDFLAEDGLDLGVELFYQGYTESTEDFGSFKDTYSHSLFGVDALAYYPILEKMKSFVGLGLSYHLFSWEHINNGTKAISYEDNKFGINFLGGFQYYVLDSLSVRARVKYLLAHANLDLTIGANYHF